MPNDNAEKAQGEKMYDFIVKSLESGRTVYLATHTRITKLQKKHLPQVRVRNGALEIQSGKRWLDYTYTKLSAQ